MDLFSFSILSQLLPNGTYPLSDVECHLNEVLRYATIDILSMIEDKGGFWEWIRFDDEEAPPDWPFKLQLENGMITKVSFFRSIRKHGG